MSVALAQHVGPWTIDDVEALPDNGDHARYELLSPGVLTVSPAPGTRHQRASRALANLMQDAADEAGLDVEVLEAVNVVIPGGRLSVPDIAVVNGPYADTDPSRYPASEVLCVVEIVSPSTHPQDRIIKPMIYAEAGIPVYWRVELERSPHVIVSELRRGQYTHTLTAFADTATTVSRPFPVTLDPAQLVLRSR
ncbi:Uma2 family endonuclease [Crossiella equi]|uniref:Uma2 family endonuclease n=1 Tax=Crossiella equi TaxID=130796 RepID=A0ABS5AKW3_9PSEU|nr:Uma2 family endonuclease [Crossiella equi]MBP2477210.1 Uma2 family endonuclease [Crossiella equi]